MPEVLSSRNYFHSLKRKLVFNGDLFTLVITKPNISERPQRVSDHGTVAFVPGRSSLCKKASSLCTYEFVDRKYRT